MTMRLILIAILCALPVTAVTKTVKTSGGDYSDIGACMNAISAGDICEVYAGTWSGWTQSSSGTAGNPKTALAHAGDTVNITSTTISLGSRSYISIKNFSLISVSISCATNCDHIIVEGNTFTGTNVFYSADGASRNSSNSVFRSNTVNVNSTASTAPAVYWYGDSNLFESNTIYGGGGDCFEGGGANIVVRNNVCRDMDATTSGEHIDFWQTIGGGTVPTTSFSLFEGNSFLRCTDPTGNCHLGIHRQGGGTGDTIITRYNWAYDIDGSGVGYGGIGDNAPNGCFVHNTVHTLTLGTTNGDCVSFQNASGGQVFNNICSQSLSGGTSPTVSVGNANGNIAYTSGYASTWNSPYSSEATYASLRNQNPLYVDISAGPQIQSGSPAKDASVAITTVHASDSGSGTTLVLSNSHCFQPGWAGINGDVLLIGTSTTATISSIDYSTNTVTLTGSVSRSSGDAVRLYQRSDGTGTANGVPDIGAYEYVTPPPATVPRFGGNSKSGGNSRSN